MKIVLANPPFIKERYMIYVPHVGILYLISFLRKHFRNLEFCYIEGSLSLKKHLEKVRKFKPDIYGLTITSFTSSNAYITINAVKNMFPDLPVICGGPHPSAAFEEVLNLSRADVCVIGEGEETMTELVSHYIKKTTSLDTIAGIAFRKSGKIKMTSPRPFIKDLDSIPFPAWDIIKPEHYPGMSLLRKRPYLMVVVSRGCPYNCAYCSNPVWKSGRPWHRVRSPENIAQEVKLLYGMGVRELTLRCDEFNINLNWSISVCEEIKKLGYHDLYFQTILRADKITDKLSKALNDINCWLVFLGIESGNQRTLDGYGKGITLEQVPAACKILKSRGIRIFGFFMSFNVWEENGKLCYEKPGEVMNTLNFARELLSSGLLDFNSWSLATPIIGAQLWHICLKHNLISEKQLTSTWGASPVKLPGINTKIIQKIKRKGTLLEIRYILLNGLRFINFKNWKYFVQRIKYFFQKSLSGGLR